MKYRIIEEVDGNDRRHYELEFWRKSWFKMRWVKVESYRHDFATTRNFSSYDEAMEYVNAFKTTRTVVAEGDTDDN